MAISAKGPAFPGSGSKRGLSQLLQMCPWATTSAHLLLLLAERIVGGTVLKEEDHNLLAAMELPQTSRAHVGNAWLAAHPNWLLLFHAWDCVSFPLDRQCSLLTWSSSKHTSSLLANCLIWVGISSEQDQARVHQIRINCFLLLRCHIPGQATLHLPEICSLSCSRTVLGISKGHRVTFKAGWTPSVPHVHLLILAPNTKDDSALVLTRGGAQIPPPDQPPIKT